ncbi:MAG: hypothetical protein QOF43_1571 [Gaiellaceae bacterium]|nr:hypothetical protein [Gaiellaceae bacterium]
MADWVTISALATAGGTLALAGATYGAVRSGNRAARAAELSLLTQLRPLLIQSSPGDPPLRAGFADGVGVTAPGEGAGIEIVDGRIYLAISLRNVGPGIAVLHGGYVDPKRRPGREEHVALDRIHMLSRDIYIPPGKIGFWQIAFRDPGPDRDAIAAGIESGAFGVEVLYGDYEGGQRVVSRFGVLREGDGWLLSAARHWQVDRADPR